MGSLAFEMGDVVWLDAVLVAVLWMATPGNAGCGEDDPRGE